MANKKERTYVMIKADGVQRSLVGEIVGRFERAGLKIVGLKMFVPTREQAEANYGKSDDWCQEKGQGMIDALEKRGDTPDKTAVEYGRGIVSQLLDYVISGPVVGMVLEGNQAVAVAQKLIGSTEPVSSDVGTVRGDFTLDSYEIANLDGRAVRNLIHRSDDPSEAEGEVKIWFNESDLISYRHINEAMLYDVNLDGILE